MEYPHFNVHIKDDDLIEHFTLAPEERYLLSQWRTDTNILGFAVLMKSFQFLGYPPRQKADIPESVRHYISRQLKFNAKYYFYHLVLYYLFGNA